MPATTEHDRPNTTFEDFKLIAAIVKRATSEIDSLAHVDTFGLIMDVDFTHARYPLQLRELLNADAGNFGHDITGIYANFNRQTYELDNCFVPRYSVPDDTPLNTDGDYATTETECAEHYRLNCGTCN